MHKHDQGLQTGCRWCDLDLLLHELAIQWGPSNLDSYLRTEMNSIWAAHERREEEERRYGCVEPPRGWMGDKPREEARGTTEGEPNGETQG